MKIKNIAIQGFRGFNEERTIDFHDRLTLVYGPNSYGKSSISEALEWLLYGVTSKMESADSKEEYKGSYRNCHLPESLTPFVKATFVEDTNEMELRGELEKGETIARFVDGQGVESWPFVQDLSQVPKPFVLQHALQYLLLTGPDKRFQGFARLLGLEELEQIQRNVVSLCTKPDSHIPVQVEQVREETSALEARLASQPSLAAIQRAFKKGKAGLSEAYKAIASECRRRVPPETEEGSVLPRLRKIRGDAAAKIFEGNIALPDYSQQERQANAEDEQHFLHYTSDTFVKGYSELIAVATVQHILDRARFFDLGTKLLEAAPAICPFCGQVVDAALFKHIHNKHENLVRDKQQWERLEAPRTEIMSSLADLRQRLDIYQTRHIDKTKSLLSMRPSMGQLKTIFMPKPQIHFDAVEGAMSELATAKEKLEASHSRILEALSKVQSSVTESKEDVALIEDFTEALVLHICNARSYVGLVSGNVSAMSQADYVLKQELDTLAGTEDISVLIDLHERRRDIEKSLEIEDILESRKDLRKIVDRYVANKVLDAILGELNSEVKHWYGQIKTRGDPDVHFTGFDIERTKKGHLKARRIEVKAESYGESLASAVSSLSESKLNALGLCVSIATNLKGRTPFEFLIIDDPIQSLDAEHEIQFIQVIRGLVEKKGKQVILLSHNRKWLDQVSSGCRTLNGLFYEITGYTKAGPNVKEIPWCKWKARLDEVDAIVKDPEATSVRLQQAEEEIRITVAQVSSELYFKEKGVEKSPHNLNSTKVRKMLLECGVELDLVDRISETFETTGAAHHAPIDYAARRQRIRCYHDWTCELAKLLSEKE